MIASPTTVDVPLHLDEHGKFRIGDTRVLLELVIRAFNDGETPESIVDSYSTLKLVDVYAVVTYYLANREEVDRYVREADQRIAQLQRDEEANASPEANAFRAGLRAAKADKLA